MDMTVWFPTLYLKANVVSSQKLYNMAMENLHVQQEIHLQILKFFSIAMFVFFAGGL